MADAIDDFLVEVETLRGDDPAAALKKLAGAPPELARRPESRLLAADLTWELQGAKAAQPLLVDLVKDVPDYADARHLLGSAYEELGNERDKIEQFLEVLRLDEGLDQALEEEDADELENLIVEAAEQTITGLPAPFRQQLASVPILVEPRPSEDLVREGFDPRAFGLFEGPTHVEHQNGEASELPTRIVLYSSNLLAESLDEDQLRDEVETTVLHEAGHYFGLDEDDLARLGLD
jgi:predicted Zn-dependent protease with MMP-like domain